MKGSIILRLFNVILFSFFMFSFLDADKIDNKVEIKATIIDCIYIEDSSNEEGGGWHGIYKFSVDGKDYTFTGNLSCNPKSIVSKSTKVLYNEKNPSEFTEKTPSILFAILLITIVYNAYMLLKTVLSNMKHYLKSKKKYA